MSDAQARQLAPESVHDIEPVSPQAPVPDAANAPEGVPAEPAGLPPAIPVPAPRQPKRSRAKRALSLAGTACLYLAAALVVLMVLAFLLASPWS